MVNNSLPAEGYIRLAQLVPGVVPVCKSTIWNWVKEGKFPKPVKLSGQVTVWRVESVREWMAQNGTVH
ncbi:helix-turn-helix transcriptional regulator [Dyella kyungheensis]|uniref:helix-turn-helix transcriptional regulator n=1 Tax=Dyella kyungheensis TaxID=1242174 RepID=UPI003CED8B5D